MKLLMILQSPLSQQSQKLQDHVLKISRYCWPIRARLQPGKGGAVRQEWSQAQGGRTLSPFKPPEQFFRPLSGTTPHRSALGLPLMAPGNGLRWESPV